MVGIFTRCAARQGSFRAECAAEPEEHYSSAALVRNGKAKLSTDMFRAPLGRALCCATIGMLYHVVPWLYHDCTMVVPCCTMMYHVVPCASAHGAVEAFPRSSIAGKVAVVARGGCLFIDKVCVQQCSTHSSL